MAENELDTSITPPAMAVFNPDEYMSDLEGLDFTEEQKVEFLRTMWWIMSAMVNLGFGIDSVIPAFQKASEIDLDRLKDSNPKDDFSIAAHRDAPERTP